ncbi:hypothetical protein M3231_04850 [Neobacillus mesonae]|nr:hypothetical protein [Neobacillus mesonae]
MKKKMITALIAASMMAGGVVSAANLWGTYKGNDIVKITFHGVDLKTIDVPAMNYESRTMIPFHMLGRMLFLTLTTFILLKL